MTDFLPPKLAGIIFYGVLLPFMALFIYTIFDFFYVFYNSAATAETFQVSFYLSFFASTLPATWMYRKQSIHIDSIKAIFRFTRYCVPKHHAIDLAEITKFTFVPGELATDGRPRPYFEFEMESGKNFWVPLPIYTGIQINQMLKMLPEAHRKKRRGKL